MTWDESRESRVEGRGLEPNLALIIKKISSHFTEGQEFFLAEPDCVGRRGIEVVFEASPAEVVVPDGLEQIGDRAAEF